jgi:hypothetical protein
MKYVENVSVNFFIYGMYETLRTLYGATSNFFVYSIKLDSPFAQPIIERALWHGCGEARGVMMQGAPFVVFLECVGLVG